MRLSRPMRTPDGSLRRFPRVHGRPMGHRQRSFSSTTMAIRSIRSSRCPNRRITLRSRCAACRPWCQRSRAYNGKTPRPIDGGYYMRTRENRPLIGPVPVEGAYISCAFSGFGVMASCAGQELVAATSPRLRARLCASLSLSRYDDVAYSALLDRWGDGGQL